MGPLKGYRIIEIAGIGPGPFACMMLADMGADVIRLERATGARGVDAIPGNIGNRSRRSVGVDLKNPDAVELILQLVEQADALVEGFRAGVAERLGIGPDVCLARNPRLVYGRMTGWGQDGPYASMAGHDINYIALAGALAHFGRPGEPPVPPINMVGDFGGGGMLMAFGVVCGLLEAKESGQGQVVDAAMVDGSATLMAMIYGLRAMGLWSLEKGTNIIDGGAHFYDAYETADGKYVSVGSIEPQFYAELLRLTGLEGEDLPRQMDRSQWPALKERMAGIFKQKTRDEWCELLEGTDVCFAPVLTMEEAPSHPHNVARRTFVEIDGVVQPAPSPRFSRTPGEISKPPSAPAADTDEALADWGLSDAEIAKLRSAGAIA